MFREKNSSPSLKPRQICTYTVRSKNSITLYRSTAKGNWWMYLLLGSGLEMWAPMARISLLLMSGRFQIKVIPSKQESE